MRSGLPLLILLAACSGRPVALVPSTPGWRVVKPTVFSMGSPTTERCREIGGSKETPHQVTITRVFEVAPTETTQQQFRSAMGYNPAQFAACGDDCPVEGVSHNEAEAYCNAMSGQEGLEECYTCSGSGTSVVCKSGQPISSCSGYRLPTEAEWEYTYRARSTAALYTGTVTNCLGVDQAAAAIGWYDRNAAQSTHQVKQKLPNAWGLYDMAGNVLEWVHDKHKADLGATAVTDPEGPAQGGRNVIRGGSWKSYAMDLRAAARQGLPTGTRASTIGFRCARTLQLD